MWQLERFRNAKVAFRVIQDHWNWCHILLVIRCYYVCFVQFPRYYHLFPTI